MVGVLVELGRCTLALRVAFWRASSIVTTRPTSRGINSRVIHYSSIKPVGSRRECEDRSLGRFRAEELRSAVGISRSKEREKSQSEGASLVHEDRSLKKTADENAAGSMSTKTREGDVDVRRSRRASGELGVDHPTGRVQ